MGLTGKVQLMKSHLNKISISATDQEKHGIQKRPDSTDMSQTVIKMYQLLKVRNLYNVYIKNTDILSSKNKLSSTMKIQKYSNLQQWVNTGHHWCQPLHKQTCWFINGCSYCTNRCMSRSDKVKCFSAGFHSHSMRNNPSKCNWQLAFLLALLFDKLSTCFSSFSTDPV